MGGDGIISVTTSACTLLHYVRASSDFAPENFWYLPMHRINKCCLHALCTRCSSLDLLHLDKYASVTSPRIIHTQRIHDTEVSNKRLSTDSLPSGWNGRVACNLPRSTQQLSTSSVSARTTHRLLLEFTAKVQEQQASTTAGKWLLSRHLCSALILGSSCTCSAHHSFHHS